MMRTKSNPNVDQTQLKSLSKKDRTKTVTFVGLEKKSDNSEKRKSIIPKYNFTLNCAHAVMEQYKPPPPGLNMYTAKKLQLNHKYFSTVMLEDLLIKFASTQRQLVAEMK